jgi:predicted metal-dependent hydrolase
MAKKYSASIEVKGQVLPVELVLERRNGTRYSITRKKIILRMPTGVTKDQIYKTLGELQVWVANLLVKKPDLLNGHLPKTYQSGQRLQVGARQYTLDVSNLPRRTSSARLLGDTIYLEMNETLTVEQRQKAIKTLLSRVIAQDFEREITDRVLDINRRTFQQPIKAVYLKYNHSNWGSCSSDGNVNLSTRLLFAPREVQDYVILHELAHRVEMNHSDRFWDLVARHMPDYQSKEKWLRDHALDCDF